MSILEELAVAMPISRTDLERASRDPLSSPTLLRRLYYDYRKNDDTTFHNYHLSNLANNPSLPSDVLVPLLLSLKEIEDKFSNKPMSLDMLSNFFSNPSTTFEQVLDIVCNSTILNDISGVKQLKSSKTVIEVFDRLAPLLKIKHQAFFSRLLCSPLISDQDFKLRILDEKFKDKLDSWIIYASSRFVPSDADYHSALDTLERGSYHDFALNTLKKGKHYDFDNALSIIRNENSSAEFLAEAFSCAAGQESVEIWVYKNLNCPIELSAHFLLKNMDDYRWRPSYLLAFNLKANEYLTLTAGEGPWEDLPLSWKLRAIAG